MAYKAEIYQAALNELSSRREAAFLKSEKVKKDIASKIPELDDIQLQLAKTGFEISKVLLHSHNKKADIEELHKENAALQQKRAELLKKNGFSPDALKIQYTCPYCKDSGFIEEKLCTCHIELLREMQRRQIRRITPLDECTFESFDTKYYPETLDDSGISPKLKAEKIAESCNRFANLITHKCEKNLLLAGGTGLGKTHLSLAIANVAINRGLSVIYGSSQNIFSDLQNEHFGRVDGIRYSQEDVISTDLLILDDLGTEYSSAYTTAALYNIINTRLLAKKPTIINTNLEIDEMNERYDDRVTSRISGCYTAFVLVGHDIRYIK